MDTAMWRKPEVMTKVQWWWCERLIMWDRKYSSDLYELLNSAHTLILQHSLLMFSCFQHAHNHMVTEKGAFYVCWYRSWIRNTLTSRSFSCIRGKRALRMGNFRMMLLDITKCQRLSDRVLLLRTAVLEGSSKSECREGSTFETRPQLCQVNKQTSKQAWCRATESPMPITLITLTLSIYERLCLCSRLWDG